MDITKFSEMAKQAKTGELADEELANVVGGASYNNDWRERIQQTKCDKFKCKCGCSYPQKSLIPNTGECDCCKNLVICNNCEWCSNENGLLICKNPLKEKHGIQLGMCLR